MGWLKKAAKGVGGAVGGVVGGVADIAGGFLGGAGIDTGDFKSKDPMAGYRQEMLAKARQPINIQSDPGVEAMRKRLALLGQAPATPQMALERSQGGPNIQDGPLKEFSQMRDQQVKRINQQANADSQANQEAMTRRFARMGGLNSGAFVKQTQLAQDAMDRSKADQIQDATSKLDLAEAQERQRRNEFETQRFDAKQESMAARNLNRESTNMSAKIDSEFKNRVFQADNESKLAQLDLAHKNMQLEKDAQEFNKLVAAIEAGNPQGLIGSLFGPGGVPGLSKLPIVGGLFR